MPLFLGTKAFATQLEQILQTGDVILVELNCYGCTLIASTTDSRFSHSGVVIREEREIYVAEALGDVHLLRLSDFLRRAKSYEIYRNKEIAHLKIAGRFQEFEDNFVKLYQSFHGLPFDREYLWDNFDSVGREKLYCSEFLTKILNPFLSSKIPVEPMDFSENWEYWQEYFRGEIPQGKLGNSPATFSQSEDFFLIFSA